MLLTGILLLFQLQYSIAQKTDIWQKHPINPNSFAQQPVQTTGVLNIIAVMVEFEPDSNRLTSGTGIFGPGGLPYLENNPSVTIDPLPHDRKYFEAHLEFAKNYYEKASGGQLTLHYRVLPDVYKLEKKMEEYSPTGETFTYEKIAYLIRDTWAKVEETGGFDAAGLDPGQTAFIIFHAGVGRDIELTGTTLDITPLDIPSVYLGKERLGELLGDSSFDGIPVNNGQFKITNSMIIPRTESRRGLDIQQNEFVLPLSINGLLCASIGSHLGLPDLFNTETGESGIGRFGLMDGAGFFSYNGLFPPLPSAWERIYLGWESPFQINKHTPDSVALPAAALGMPNSIARYDISSTEYFLVENRHRDLNSSGVTLTIRKEDGSTVQQTFDNKNDTFIYQEDGFEQLFEKGVLVDVDNFDWSLPGGYDIGPDNKENTADDRFLNGGILIWHIDEAVINRHIHDNTINNNLSRRGIVLMEADGAQDIGKPLAGSADNTTAYGTAFDFWWRGNDYRVITDQTTISLYKNEFSPTSTPNNNSNSGAVSGFRFYDFSDNQPVAFFKVEAVQPDNSPAPEFTAQLNADTFYTEPSTAGQARPLALSYTNTGGENTVIIPSAGGTWLHFPETGNSEKVSSNAAEQPLAAGSIYIPEKVPAQHVFNILPFRFENGRWEEKSEIPLLNAQENGLLSTQTGDTLAVDGTTQAFLSHSLQPVPDYRASSVQESEIRNSYRAENLEHTVKLYKSGRLLQEESKTGTTHRSYAGLVQLDGSRHGFFVLEDEALYFINPESEYRKFTVLHSGSPVDWPAIADWDNDGELDFIFTDYGSNTIKAVNQNGAVIAGFKAAAGERFAGTPVIADLTGNGHLNLISAAQSLYDVNLRIFDNTGNETEFSPLYAGGVTDADALPVNPVLSGKNLLAVSQTGELKSWYFDKLTEAPWYYKYGNPQKNKISGLLPAGTPAPAEFEVLNAGETYNWPNPADNETNIRFQIIRPGGSVEITVISLSGRIMYKQNLQSPGGSAEEIILDTSAWPSGGYYAMIKATVNGKSESKLVKIAVAH